MLFQATNIIPDVRTGIGMGTVDVTQGIEFSWEVSGDYPVMTGYQVQIYQNDPVSTLIQTVGPVTLATPFIGTDPMGNPQIFSFTLAANELDAGIVNGNEYKYVITQYYAANGTQTGGSIRQSSASVFLTRAAPTLADVTQWGIPMPQYPGDMTITAPEITFRYQYTQADGDALEWIRYTVTESLDGVNRSFYDSGVIYAPGADSDALPTTVYTAQCSGLMTIQAEGMSGLSYTVEAHGQTSGGVTVTSGTTVFRANYSYSRSDSKKLQVTVDKAHNAVKIDLTQFAVIGANNVILYRSGGQTGASMAMVMDQVPQGGDTEYVYDYGACSARGPYKYYCFVNTPQYGWTYYPWSDAEGNALSISPLFVRWTLLVCTENADGSYAVNEEYTFRNNLDSGSVSNNNTPYLAPNFTAAPTVQISPQNYRSGSITALIGSVSGGGYTGDTFSLRTALLALSTSQAPMFLKSPKGDLMRIRISGPVSFSIQEGNPALPQTVTLPWVEIEDASLEKIVQVHLAEVELFGD